MPKTGTVPAAAEAAQRLAQQMGYDFIDAELIKENGAAFLRVYIDHPEGLSLGRLEAFHRAVLPLVEHLTYDYFEVSSPGLDRPLKRDADFDRMRGKKIEVRLYKAVDGKKAFTGTLLGLADGQISLETADGPLQLDRKDCALVKPVVEFHSAKEEDA